MRYVVALVVALMLNATANLLMKAGMSAVQQSGGILKNGVVSGVGTILTNVPLIIGLACFGLNAAFYMYALQSKTLQISIAYPIMVGGGYALIATAAYVFLSERINVGQAVGVGLILAGVVVVAVQTRPAAS